MSVKSLTQSLAQAVTSLRYEDLPDAVVEKAKTVVADTLIVAAAGRMEPSSSMSAAVGFAPGSSRVWFAPESDSRTALDATFINTLNAGALDYDSLNGAVHADLVTLGAAWAMAEQCERRPREMLAAHIIASEVVSRLSRGAGQPSKGWSGTSIYGCLGAAIASGLMLGLSEAQMVHALGLAVSQAAGTQQANIENTLAKRLQPAMAARSGVFAALLAKAGATAPKLALEGKFGLRALYQAGDDSHMLDGWSTEWQFLDTAIKRYPICACSHAAVHALWELQGQQGFKPEQVVQLTAEISPFMHRLVGGPFVVDGDLQVLAQFNLRYQLASTLLRGPIGLEHLAASSVLDPGIAQLLPAISLQVDVDNHHELAPAAVTVLLSDGRRLTHTCTVLPGSPLAPLTATEWKAKATECAVAAGLSDEYLSTLLEKLTELPELRSLACVWSRR